MSWLGTAKRGNRVSLLPYSVYCGGVAKLNSEHGASRAAAMSSAFHAHLANEPEAKERMARLSDREFTIVLSWQPPTTVHYCQGVVLDYASAEKELEVGLDEYGYYCPAGDERCISVGHLDFAWVRELHDGQRVAFVADIKKTAFTAADGAESLQLHAYAHAFASLHSCQAYCTGLWLAEEGEWVWSKGMVVMGSERQLSIWERLYYAIQNTNGEYNSGAHCSGCYSRLHCPEYALPAMTADSWLAPVNNIDALSSEDAGELVKKIAAFQDIAEKVKGEIQERVKRGTLTVEADGKRWLPVQMPGRKSVNMEALRESLGPKMAAFETVGAPYVQFRWKKGK